MFAKFHLATLAAAQGKQAGLDSVRQRLHEVADKGDRTALAAVVGSDRRAARENMRLCPVEATQD